MKRVVSRVSYSCFVKLERADKSNNYSSLDNPEQICLGFLVDLTVKPASGVGLENYNTVLKHCS